MVAVPVVSVVGEEVYHYGLLVIVADVVGALVVGRGPILAAERATSVKIGPDQFPDIWARIVHYAEAFGLDEVPDAWVVQQGGILNAFASKRLRRNFIRINAEILEVGTTDIGPRRKDARALDLHRRQLGPLGGARRGEGPHAAVVGRVPALLVDHRAVRAEAREPLVGLERPLDPLIQTERLGAIHDR